MTIILNGLPRKKKKFYKDIYPVLQPHFTFEILETKHASHAVELAFLATEKKVPVLLVAGGDGTLHQVINGVLKSKSIPPILGLIPLGSANDFARTCGLKSKPETWVQLLKVMQPKLTDVGEIQCVGNNGEKIQRYFINVCSVGMGPEVVRRLLTSKSWFGPSISYLSSILSTFIFHRPQEVEYQSSTWKWKGRARVVALANGKSFGDATYIAPDAQVDDGVLNSFVADNVPLWKFLLYLQTIKGKKKINDARIHYNSTAGAQLTAPEKCPFEADGELIGILPATIKVLPGKIYFLR